MANRLDSRSNMEGEQIQCMPFTLSVFSATSAQLRPNPITLPTYNRRFSTMAMNLHSDDGITELPTDWMLSFDEQSQVHVRSSSTVPFEDGGNIDVDAVGHENEEEKDEQLQEPVHHGQATSRLPMLDVGLEEGAYHHDVVLETAGTAFQSCILKQFLSEEHEMVRQARRLLAILRRHFPFVDSVDSVDNAPSASNRVGTGEVMIPSDNSESDEDMAFDDATHSFVKGLRQLPAVDQNQYTVDGHLNSNAGLRGIPFRFLSMSPDVWVALDFARTNNQLYVGHVPYDALTEGFSRSPAYSYPRWLKSVKHSAAEVSKLWKYALVQGNVEAMDLCRVGGLIQACSCSLVRSYIMYRQDAKASFATLRSNLNQIKSFHRLVSRAYTKLADSKKVVDFGSPSQRYHLNQDILTHEFRKLRDSGELDALINMYTKRSRSVKASKRSKQRSNYRLLIQSGQILSLDTIQTTCIALYDLIDATLRHARDATPPLPARFFNKKRCHKMREWICTLLLFNLKGNRPQVAIACCIKDIRMVGQAPQQQPSLTFDTLVEKTNSRRNTYHLPISMKFYRLLQSFLHSPYFVCGALADAQADVDRWRYTHVLARLNEHNHVVAPAPNFVNVALRNTWMMLHPKWTNKCPTPTVLRKSWATIHFQQWLDGNLWPSLDTKDACLSHLAARMNTSAEELCKTYILVDIRERMSNADAIEVDIFARPSPRQGSRPNGNQHRLTQMDAKHSHHLHPSHFLMTRHPHTENGHQNRLESTSHPCVDDHSDTGADTDAELRQHEELKKQSHPNFTGKQTRKKTAKKKNRKSQKKKKKRKKRKRVSTCTGSGSDAPTVCQQPKKKVVVPLTG